MYQTAEAQDALKELQIAWNHFNYAEPEFVDAVTYRLTAAISRFNAVYAGLKKFCPENLEKHAYGGVPNHG